MTKSIDGAIVDWLEEIPIEELTNENAQMIVEQFRMGTFPVHEAIQFLEEECSGLMQEWIDQNKQYAKLFK